MTAALRTTSPRPARQHGPSPLRTGRGVVPMCRAHVEPAPEPRSATRRAGRPSEATFRRRRAVVGTILAVFVAVGLVVAHDVLAGSGGVPASAAESLPAHVTVVALPGDTLWSIADEYRGDIAISSYVDMLVSLNGGASIEAGQQIVLP